MKDTQDPKGDTQEALNFGERVLYTEEFLQVWHSLPPQKQRIIRKKVGLLITNPGHPSVKAHRLKRDSEVWECYLINSFPHRLLFQRQGDKILLAQMGSHRVTDRSRLVINGTSIATMTNDLVAGRDTAIHRTESPNAPHTALPQKSYQEDFVVASTEEIMTAFLESEPQYENLYRRLADI